MGKLDDRNAVVTGGGGGIGREVCLALASEGAKVLVNDVGAARDGAGSDVSAADKVVAEIKERGGTAISNHDSVASFNAAEAMIKMCVDSFGSIDILVNLAGPLRERMIWNMTEEEWDTVLTVHLKGTFNCSRHACVQMKQQGRGRIITAVSDAWRGTVGQSNYGSAKAGMVGLTRAMAREMGRFGVTANAIAPIAATRMTLDEGVKAGMKKRLESGLITQAYYDNLMRMPGPEFVAPMVVFLATDAAANINGQVFHIEKGRASIYSEPVEVRAIYKGENGGMWTVDELEELVPKTLLVGYTNPAPPQTEEKKSE
ncbi:MAG: SDR family oxidoreductase [Chloroflexota bacterium]|nr:SDR family oxidoreductase [Chloroflexota bacterium]